MEISIKKEELAKKSIFVATPMYGGMNHGLYAKACLDLQAICMQYGVQVKFSFLFNNDLNGTIDVSSLPAGTYFLQVNVEGILSTSKFIKE